VPAQPTRTESGIVLAKSAFDAMKAIRLRPIFKSISLTFVTEAIVLASFFLIYRLIAKNLGAEGVGQYSLVRRTIGLFWPLLILGLGVGLPRYIAMSQDENQRRAYISSAGLVAVTFTCAFLLIINVFKRHFAKIFFGDIDYANLVLPFSVFLLGLVFHILVYSYSCGRLLVRTFNSLQITNLAIVPIVILVVFRNITVQGLLTVTGFSTLIISSLFFLSFVKDVFGSIEKPQFKSSLKELLCYSLPRVPGDFALAGLFSLGPIIGAHFAPIEDVGYLAVSQSLLTTAGATIAPLGTILLPKVSNLIARGSHQTIRQNVNLLVAAVLQFFSFLCVQVLIFTDVIVTYWLGAEFSPAIPVMRIIFISIVFYAFYVAMRSILDAAKVKPVNAINLFICFGVFVTLAAILLFLVKAFSPIVGLSVAFTVAMVCLGILSYASVRSIYPESIIEDWNCLWIAILVNILLGGMAIFAKSFLISTFHYLIFFEVLVGLVYLSILWSLKMDWLRQIARLIRIESSPSLAD